DRLSLMEAKRASLLQRKVEIQGQLQAIEKARRDKLRPEAILALVSDLSNRASQEGSRSILTTTLQDQMAPLLQEEQKLLERYGPNHPEVQSVRKRIEVARQ